MRVTPAFFVFLSLSFVAPAPGAADTSGLVEAAKRERDDLDPARLHAAADEGTRAAAEALIEAYGLFNSTHMRREVVRALAELDGVAEAEEIALEKIANVATEESEPELRRAAVEALASSPSLGKFFLRRVVDSPADPSVRVDALRRHIEQRTDEDLAWYEELFRAPERKERAPKTRSGDRVRAVNSLTELRELALVQIAPGLKSSEIASIAREKAKRPEEPRLDGIRRIALAELVRRDDKKLPKVADTIFKDTAEHSENRVMAAGVLFAERGAKLAKRFIDVGTQDPSVTPTELHLALAAMVGEVANAKIEKSVVKGAVKGGVRDRLFALRALTTVEDAKQRAALREAALEWLGEEENALVAASMLWLAEHDATAAIEPIEAVLASATSPSLLTVAMQALGTLRSADSEWLAVLEGYASHDGLELRNAALRELHRLDEARYEDLILESFAHEHWSTRLVALELLEVNGDARAVGAMIERLPLEGGRVLDEIYESLWRLTGRGFRNPRAWEGYWRDHQGDFVAISESELEEKREERERLRLMQSSKAPTFFGVRVVSKRVLFVIDTSGSMNFDLPPEFVGEPPRPRFDLLKEALAQCLGQLGDDSLFNIVTFGQSVDHWLEGGVTASRDASRDDALEFVSKLRAGGGTPLYGALHTAFGDTDVDTIFLLSDGEPSFSDPFDIRRRVQTWNENRGVVIHTVSIGGHLKILEWLAEDSGGDYLRYE